MIRGKFLTSQDDPSAVMDIRRRGYKIAAGRGTIEGALERWKDDDPGKIPDFAG